MEEPISHLQIYDETVSYTKSNGTNTTISVPLFEIPAGTLLFRGVQLPNPKKEEDPRMFVKDWLGYPTGERFCMTPTRNTFFYTTPHVPFGAHTVGEWFNAIMIYQTVKNLRVVSMISPSKWARGGEKIRALDGTAPIQRCDKFDYTCLPDKGSFEALKEKELNAWDNCIHPEFAASQNVSGWMAIADYDSLDNKKEGLQGKDTTMGKYIMELDARLPGKGVELLTSTYTDTNSHRGFPEVVLFPWSPHPGLENQYTEARTQEDAADAIAQMSDRFNYLPIACITERGILEAFTGDFKADDLPAYAASAAPGPLTRKVIDELQSKYLDKLMRQGVDIPSLGRSRARFDSRTGFYVMDVFPDLYRDPSNFEYKNYKEFLMNLETRQEREKVLEYKIKYRTFDPYKFRTSDTLIDGTPVKRNFTFERPDKLYEQFQQLNIRPPASLIPYTLSATEVFHRNLADKMTRLRNVRGAEEAKRKAEIAKQEIQNSLDIIAKSKQERIAAAAANAKKTAPKGAKPQTVVAPVKKEEKPQTVVAPVKKEEKPQTVVAPVKKEAKSLAVPTLPPLDLPPPALPVAAASKEPTLSTFQTTIPILRTKEEAIKVGIETIKTPGFQRYFSQDPKGRIVKVVGPWQMNEKALRTSLEYIYDFMHQTCYMLCIKEGVPFLYKLEGGGLPTEVRKVLQTEITKKGYTDIDLNKTRLMQCIIKPYQEKGSTADEWIGFLRDLVSKGFQLPNGIFILNLTDALLLRNDQTDPFLGITNRFTDLDKRFYDQYQLPILGYSGHIQYNDVPIPNFDDVFEIKRTADGAVDIAKTLGGEPTLDWSKKQTKAVFRGGTTGCGYTTYTNPRIRLTDPKFLTSLSPEIQDMLDVGITTITKQYKMDTMLGLGRVDPATVKVVPPLTMVDQSKAKYIIHVDGNVFAYRLLKTMLTGSLILRAESVYKGWVDEDPEFEEFNISSNPDDLTNKCYIRVMSFFEDLEDVLDWCVKNDDVCRQIAANGKAYAEKVLQRDYIYGTFVNTLNTLTYSSTLSQEPKTPPFSGGSRNPKQTRKQRSKRNKKTQKQRKEEQQTPLILADYRGGSAPEMDDYIQSTMKNLWQTFSLKSNSSF